MTPTSLFGSYLWNDDESDAQLVVSPLHDNVPFSDTLFVYRTDELLAEDILKANPPDQDYALVNGGPGGATRSIESAVHPVPHG